jgi:predicted nuclease of predicted toxin-antitoxin system
VNLVADEGVDSHIVAWLRQDGHDVLYIAEIEPSISDDMVLSRANAQGSLLLTEDKDFGELVFRQRLVHTGVVLIRLGGLSACAQSFLYFLALRPLHSASILSRP